MSALERKKWCFRGPKSPPQVENFENPNSASDYRRYTLKWSFTKMIVFAVFLRVSKTQQNDRSPKWSFRTSQNFTRTILEKKFCFVFCCCIFRTEKRKFDRTLSDLAPIMNTNSRETISSAFARVKQQAKRHTKFQNTTFFCIRTFWMHWFQKLSKMIVH